MQYVNCNGRVWKMSDREFKRQLTNVANGGDFNADEGKHVGEIGHCIQDIDQEEAKELLAYEFATQKQRDKRDMERHNGLIDCGLEKPMSHDQIDAFLSR